jgi:sucrose-6-phosphate hydrolase SacC (GH32 family)
MRFRRQTVFASALCACALAALAAQPAGGPEPLRPLFHFTPPRNFMNDPNGLVFYKGEYHLFYQHNPQGNVWGHMSWGHAVSSDMMRWQHLPVALVEENGVMIFSGSVVVDWKNTSGFCRPSGGDPSCLVAVYTGHGRGRQTQNLAYSNDRGRTWTKHAGNPVIDLGLENFRDPKAFWHEPSGRWILVTVLADQHKVRLFASRDLKSWETLSDFGPAGATGGVWECPDLFPLPVNGQASEVRWVLDVDINPGAPNGGSGGQYFVGRFDGRAFVNDHPPDKTMWADYGKDFYATISFSDLPPSDGRRIWMGWISNWLYANEEPTPTWRGAQSVPRELQLRRLPDGIRLVQSPIRELNSLRAGAAVAIPAAGVALPAGADIEIELPASGAGDAGLRFANANGEEVLVGLRSSPGEVFIDRRSARKGTWHKAYPGRHAAPVRPIDGRVSLRVLFDRSVIEVFVNGGEQVLTDRVYPVAPYDRVAWIGGVQPPASRSSLWTMVQSMPPGAPSPR